jgi:hypothetical protein
MTIATLDTVISAMEAAEPDEHLAQRAKARGVSKSRRLKPIVFDFEHFPQIGIPDLSVVFSKVGVRACGINNLRFAFHYHPFHG